MNRLRNILRAALLGALTVGGVALAQNGWIHRNQWVNSGLTAGLSYFRSDTVPSPTSNGGVVTGEVGVNIDVAGGDARIGVFQPGGGWEYLAELDGATFSGDVAVTGNISNTGTVTLGDDETDDITANGPIIQRVLHESFDNQAYTMFEEDLTAAVVTDVGENYMFLPNSQIGLIWFSLEQAFAGNAAPFLNTGALNLSGFADFADTDGVDFVFGGDPAGAATGFVSSGAAFWDEDVGNSGYCEASVTLATIANIDEFYFGIANQQARWDANSLTAIDTYAAFRITDNAGDLEINTELNNGGALVDEITGAWADGETHVLKVIVNADTVSFQLDGVAVAQVNAVLNFDDGDRGVCFLGYQNSAVGATAGLLLNHIELGLNQ